MYIDNALAILFQFTEDRMTTPTEYDGMFISVLFLPRALHNFLKTLAWPTHTVGLMSCRPILIYMAATTFTTERPTGTAPDLAEALAFGRTYHIDRISAACPKHTMHYFQVQRLRCPCERRWSSRPKMNPSEPHGSFRMS